MCVHTSSTSLRRAVAVSRPAHNRPPTTMTNPRPLSLVAMTPEGPEPPVAHGKNLLRQWDPESQLVGALMHLPAAQVAQILVVVPDSVIWRPETRWAFEVLRPM